MALLLDEPAVARRPAGVVRVTGPERLGYLHTLLTQHFDDAKPGTAADFLYLDPKGNALAAGRAAVAADHVLLVTPAPEVAADLCAALERNKFLTQVEAADVTPDYALASIRGRGQLAVAGAPQDPMTAAFDGAGVIVRDRSGGVDLLGPGSWLDQQVDALGLPAATAADWETWRVSRGEPVWGAEIAPGRRPQELGLLPTHVHLRKGCYPGQESVAKTYNLGHPRRALAVIETAGSVAAGDPVEAAGRRGQVTSVAHLDGGWVALALLPAGDDGRLPTDLSVGGAPARLRHRVGEGVPIPGATPPPLDG